MKKAAAFILPVLMLFTAKAQDMHLGFKGGLNISQLHFGDGDISSDGKVGVNVGVFAHIHASKTWAIQPELLYSLEGAQKVGNSGTNYTLNYLNVPVLLQYMFSNGFRLEGGPQIGFLLSAKRKLNGVTFDDKNFKTTAFSIPLGVGYLSSSGLGIDARYVFGVSDINDLQNGPTIQSNVFQLGIFYQLSDTKMHHHNSRVHSDRR